LFNPSSGGADDELESDICTALKSAGQVSVIKPEKDTFDDEVRTAARDADVVVAAGGDGTLNWTLNALGDSLDRTVLGLIPLGTGNDLARTLGLSEDPVEVAHGLSSGTRRRLDVGRARGPGVDRLFVNACMGGFPVDVNEAIDEDTKKKLGPLAFWFGGAKALRELTKSTVTVNGTRVTDCVAAGVGNGRTCGGGMEVWPQARPDDHELDACVLSASGIADAIALAAKVKRATHLELESVTATRASEIRFESEPPLEFNVDGELVGLRTPATFEIVSSVAFAVPAKPVR
jgi:diacylglycerol kinase (ATP)